MSTTFRPYTPEQSLLLPPSPFDWLPEGHLAHFIPDMIDQFDLNSFYERYEGDGRRKQPYELRMILPFGILQPETFHHIGPSATSGLIIWTPSARCWSRSFASPRKQGWSSSVGLPSTDRRCEPVPASTRR